MTEAERLSESLCRMDTFTEHQRAEILKAASELCRLAAVEAELETLKTAISEAEPAAHIRKNGFRFLGEIEPQDDSETQLYTLKGIK